MKSTQNHSGIVCFFYEFNSKISGSLSYVKEYPFVITTELLQNLMIASILLLPLA